MRIWSRFFERIFGKMIDRRIEAYQSDLIAKQCEEVQSMYMTMRGWRHDYHNQIQMMKALIHETRRSGVESPYIEQMDAYLNRLNEDLMTVDTVLKTGNVMVDAILNSKLSVIRSREIAVNAKAVVPQTLSISEVDLCAVIGNLLDNAMEACMLQEEGSQRFIRVFIGILKEQLYISVSNSMGNTVQKQGHRYISAKDPAEHGFGLMRIDSIAAKYDGYVNRQHEEGVWVTEVLLPL